MTDRAIGQQRTLVDQLTIRKLEPQRHMSLNRSTAVTCDFEALASFPQRAIE